MITYSHKIEKNGIYRCLCGVVMDILSAVIAGIIQGATEFLPVSSSGHLSLYHFFTGTSVSGHYVTFDVFLHLGTLAAVCTVYGKDLCGLIRGYFTGFAKLICGKAKLGFCDNEKLAFFVAAATVPLVLAALIGADDAAEAMSLHPCIVGAALILNGFILLFSEKTGKTGKTLSLINMKNALFVGLCQAFAVVPGLSRSGCTVSGGLSQGLDRESAVKFSFLISVPAIIGANILKLPEVAAEGIRDESLRAYIFGFAAAAVSGFLSIRLLLYTAKKAKLAFFSYYCFALGAFAIISEIINIK